MSIKKICDGPKCEHTAMPRVEWITIKNGDITDLHFCHWACVYTFAADVVVGSMVNQPKLPLGVLPC